MNSADLGLLLAVIGLGLWLAFTQTARHMTVGPITRLLALLIIPITVAALWAIAVELHWWTVLVFVAVALAVGVINGIAMRSIGKSGLYSMQPLLGLVGIGCVLASLALRYQ